MNTYKIESDFILQSDFLSQTVFTKHYDNIADAIAIAIEGVDDPEEQEVRIICIQTNEIIWRSTEMEYETKDYKTQ